MRKKCRDGLKVTHHALHTITYEQMPKPFGKNGLHKKDRNKGIGLTMPITIYVNPVLHCNRALSLKYTK